MAGDDVDIVVSAQDQASSILKDVSKSSEALTQSITTMATKSEESAKMFDFAFKGFFVDIGSIIRGAADAIIESIGAIVDYASQSVSAFNTQEEAARGMTEAQLEFASALQVATNAGDEATLALMRQAEAMGFSKNNSDEATTAALGLAEAFGINQTEALKKLAQATSGNANAFAELLPEIKNLETEAEKLAVINEAAANGLLKLQTDAQSTKGVMERAAGAFGDLQEKVGALFEPLYRVIHQGLAVFAETLQTALMPAIDSINTGFDSVRPFIDGFMELMQASAVVVGTVVESIINVVSTMTEALFGSFSSAGNASDILAKSVDAAARYIIGAITFVEVGFTNFGTVVEMAIDAVLLHFETMRADLVHVFTEVLPKAVSWFADNFFDIIETAFSAVVTAVQNHISKIVDSLSALWDFIASGGGTDLMGQLGEIAGRSYLEGFESSIKEMPDIATRSMTEAEKRLSTKMTMSAIGIATEFNKKFEERISKLDAPINATANIDIPDLESIATKKVEESIQKQADNILEKTQKSSGGGDSQIQATESRLLTRGSQNSMAEKALRIAEEQKRQQEAMVASLAILAEGEQRRRDKGDRSLRVELV